MASRLEANKHNGNGLYLVTMDTSDIKDSYSSYSSGATSTKCCRMLPGPKCDHKCLLHIHKTHGTKTAELRCGKQCVSFLQCICVSRFPSGEVNFAISFTEYSIFVALLKLLGQSWMKVKVH